MRSLKELEREERRKPSIVVIISSSLLLPPSLLFLSLHSFFPSLFLFTPSSSQTPLSLLQLDASFPSCPPFAPFLIWLTTLRCDRVFLHIQRLLCHSAQPSQLLSFFLRESATKDDANRQFTRSLAPLDERSSFEKERRKKERWE